MTNKYYSPYLILICVIHILIWIVSMIGALFIKDLALINMIIIIPIIFIMQSFQNFHPFVIHKMKYIIENMDKFNDVQETYISHLEMNDIERIANELNITIDESLKGFEIMKEHEYILLIPKYLDNLKQKFDSSFRNPFEASGLIIISLFINIIIYLII